MSLFDDLACPEFPAPTRIPGGYTIATDGRLLLAETASIHAARKSRGKNAQVTSRWLTDNPAKGPRRFRASKLQGFLSLTQAVVNDRSVSMLGLALDPARLGRAVDFVAGDDDKPVEADTLLFEDEQHALRLRCDGRTALLMERRQSIRGLPRFARWSKAA